MTLPHSGFKDGYFIRAFVCKPGMPFGSADMDMAVNGAFYEGINPKYLHVYDTIELAQAAITAIGAMGENVKFIALPVTPATQSERTKSISPPAI